MIPNFLKTSNKNKGSSLMSPANGLGGSRATILFLLSFLKAAAAPALRALKQKGKKEGGLGEGIFALLRIKIERFRFLRKRTSLFWILFKESSNFVQKTPPSFTFSEIERCCLGAKRLGMVFFRYFEGIFEIARQRAAGNAEVPVRKHRENEVFRTNPFSFAFSERLSAFFFDCPKANYQKIWTT